MSELTTDQRAALGYALYEYPLGSPELEDAVRRLAPAVENLLAAEREAGAAEVRARVEAAIASHRDSLGGDSYLLYADRIHAALNGGE